MDQAAKVGLNDGSTDRFRMWVFLPALALSLAGVASLTVLAARSYGIQFVALLSPLLEPYASYVDAFSQPLANALSGLLGGHPDLAHVFVVAATVVRPKIALMEIAPATRRVRPADALWIAPFTLALLACLPLGLPFVVATAALAGAALARFAITMTGGEYTDKSIRWRAALIDLSDASLPAGAALLLTINALL